jgi:phosphoserine aminotransferase
MAKVFNFSPGPSKIPEVVMLRAQQEFVDWHGTGSSIMELSHRGKHFIEVAKKAELDLRELLSIPDDYHVLFLQGGAQLENAAIPMNIMGDYKTANYLVTGTWSEKSAKEAHKYTDVVLAADMKDCGYTTVKPHDQWQIDKDAAYFYYCDNETVHGIEFHDVPDVGLPLVVDMSSNLLTRKVDVSKYGIIFACAQKNFGPAGVTVVIVKDELLQREARPYTPSVVDFNLQSSKDSMLNTPPTFAWYMAGLVFEWTKEQGGVDVMNKLAQQRSQLVYDFIDTSDMFECPIDPEYRSRMNIVFDLKDESLNQKFLDAAEQQDLYYLKGHRVRGGMRASMYNAMPLEGAEKFVEFLATFKP